MRDGRRLEETRDGAVESFRRSLAALTPSDPEGTVEAVGLIDELDVPFDLGRPLLYASGLKLFLLTRPSDASDPKFANWSAPNVFVMTY